MSRGVDVAKVLARVAAGEAGRQAFGRRREGAEDLAGSAAQQRARAVRRALESLGPFYVKLGQMLSTRPDIVSDTVITEFERLHEKVAIAPFSDFEPVLEEELGPAWRSYFSDIEVEKPLGAASLAQVYKATLANGKPVVVKVQRPGVKGVMLDDMVLMRRLAKFAAKRAPDFNAVIDVGAMLDTIFEAMKPELDFTLEAQAMETAQKSVGRFKHISVPEVVHATPRVLLQGVAPGTSIRHVNRDAFSVEERAAIGTDLIKFMFRGFFVDRFFHADPHPGNIFVEPGMPATLIDWGMTGRMDRRMSTTLILVIVNLAMVDGPGVARAWIEFGRATPWADIPGFSADMARLVPKVAGASLETLNFGLTLTTILTSATRRGIQTSPVVALLGKAFANIEGSVRYLAPELSLLDVFEEEIPGILMEIARETLSQEQAARTAVELLVASPVAGEQMRTLLRDAANREFTVQVNQVQGRQSRKEDRADARAAALRRALLIATAAYVWRTRRK